MGEGLREGEEGSCPAAGERALEEEVEDEGPRGLHAVLYHHHPRRRSHHLAQKISPSVLLHGPLGKHPSPERETGGGGKGVSEKRGLLTKQRGRRPRSRTGFGCSQPFDSFWTPG